MTNRDTWWVVKHKKANKFAVDDCTGGLTLYSTKPKHLHPDWQAAKVKVVDFDISSNKKVKEFKGLVATFLKGAK